MPWANLFARVLPDRNTCKDQTSQGLAPLANDGRLFEAKDLRRNNLADSLAVILSAAKDLVCERREILRCAQDDSNGD